MATIDRDYDLPNIARARTLGEARRNGRHAAALYGGVLDRYPVDALFNTTDVRVLVRVIEDLVRPWRGQP
jgi:hypothetical protein